MPDAQLKQVREELFRAYFRLLLSDRMPDRTVNSPREGVIEISDQHTRFIPITSRKKLTGAVIAGVLLGITLGWRRRRR